MLRAGYVAFGVAFLALAGAAYLSGGLVMLGLAAGLAGGLLLAFSRDELPKWAGIAMVTYFALSLLAFLAATPITLGKQGGYFINDKPSAVFEDLQYYVFLVFPIMLGATATAATWEREWPPRVLLIASLAGSTLWAVLSYALVPPSGSTVAAAATQNNILSILAALAALAGAAGAAWAATRPDEYA
jgi:hypothetical protein